MALQQLTEADCGQCNPLLHLTTHLTRDHALSESYSRSVFANSSDQLVQQFLEEARAAPQAFRMDDLMREMHEIESQRATVPPVPANTVKDHLNNKIWAVEYVGEQKAFDEQEMRAHDDVWAEINAREHDQTQVDFHIWQQWPDEYQDKDTIPTGELEKTAGALANATDDSHFAYSKFLKFMRHASDDTVAFDNQQAQSWSDKYSDSATGIEIDSDVAVRTWDGGQGRGQPSDNGNDSNNFWDKLQEEWKKLAEQESSPEEHPWISDLNGYYDAYKDYEYSETNPMTAVANPLQKGKELLAKGDLPGAVLCFEAAVKQTPENAVAWQLLGTTQAENEQDPNAICALKRCLQLRPDNLTVLMALAVSYTNESYHLQACQSLVNWLKCHPEYSDVLPQNFQLSGQVTSLLDLDQHRAVQDLFIKVAQRRPVNPDHQVQGGLGVLFNLSGEYEKAADCFRVALKVRPEDSRLWNRLGATLANGSRPEEAVEAYHRALNLSPGFVRARYNVGITCINLGAYKQAAEHFLMALNQQARGGGVAVSGKSQMSDTIWSTLRMCASLMNRSDLQGIIDARDLDVLNRAFRIHED